MPTENRDYNVPEPGEEDWHVPVNENWAMIDADMQAALDAAQAALEAATSDGSDGSDGDDTTSSGGTGFSWDQTHVDMQWLFDADANDNLTVETVTNLDAGGSGSLAAALSAAENNANTLIVFEVGGVIDNGGDTYVRSYGGNVYIAGQTAPYPGITLIRGGFRFHGNNTIMKHVTSLPGDDVDEPNKARAITVSPGVSNFIADHCTFGWGTDEGVVIFEDTQNTAVINSINAEALNDSSHPEAPHGHAFIVRGEAAGVTYMGNLQTHNWKRNLKPNGAQIVFANNYIYNWGERVQHGGDSWAEIDWMGDIVEAGPDTDLSAGVFDGDPATVYWGDNALDPSDTPLNDGDIDYVDSPLNLPSGLDASALVSPSDLESYLVPMVGPRPADRAPHEQRVVDDFVNRSGGIIDHQSEVGGYPAYSPTSRSLSIPDTGVLDWLQGYTDEVELGG